VDAEPVVSLAAPGDRDVDPPGALPEVPLPGGGDVADGGLRSFVAEAGIDELVVGHDPVQRRQRWAIEYV